MPASLFTREEIQTALTEVAYLLDREGVAARILVFGGAALALAYVPDRPATLDVDGAFGSSAPAIAAAARKVAKARGYPVDWLIEAAKIFLPVHGDPDFRPVIRVGRVEFAVAPPDLLLAMKLKASRGRRDLDDVKDLLAVGQIHTVGQAAEIFEAYFPDDPLPHRALAALRSLLPEQTDA